MRRYSSGNCGSRDAAIRNATVCTHLAVEVESLTILAVLVGYATLHYDHILVSVGR